MIRCVLLLCLLPAFAWAQGGRYVQCRSAEQQAQAKPGDRQAVQACVAQCTGVERASGALKRCLCLQAILRADPSCPSVCDGYKPCPAARLPKKRCPADAKRAQASLDPAEHQACQTSCGPHKRCQPTCDEAIALSRRQPALAPRCAAVCGERAPECQLPLALPPEPQPELAATPPAVPEVKPETGLLTLEGTPKDAAVELWRGATRVKAGTLPLRSLELDAGTYEARISAPGFSGLTQTVRVVAGQTVVEQVALGRGTIKAETGFLTLEGTPKGAAVELWQGRTRVKAGTLPLRSLELDAGTYEARISAPGFAGLTQTVRVLCDETAVEKVALQETHGQLWVLGTPLGAKVEVRCGGEALPAAGLPLEGIKVPRGECEVTVSRRDYVSERRTVQVPAGTTGAKVEVALRREGKAGIRWVHIPGGSFLMGSLGSSEIELWNLLDESPPRLVSIGSFELSKSEVTVAQYAACVRAGACTKPDTDEYCNWGKRGREGHPINCVDWHQAKAFAAWAGGRLPTEAEWEYAARSGGQDQAYPWGDEKASCSRAVMYGEGNDGCGRDSTWPVCSKSVGNSAQGVCDLAGNVWEWVEDEYCAYGQAPTDGRAASCASADRACRGGDWSGGAADVRAANRHRGAPSNRSRFLGFRISR